MLGGRGVCNQDRKQSSCIEGRNLPVKELRVFRLKGGCVLRDTLLHIPSAWDFPHGNLDAQSTTSTTGTTTFSRATTTIM